MTEPVLLIAKREGVATLTLNRPAKMNALSRELRAALSQAFTSLQADDEVGAVILTGAGRAFCAGLDLKELGGEVPDSAASERTATRSGAEAAVAGERSERAATRSGAESAVTDGDIVRAMHRFDRPILGAVNGVAVTGGFELALACDVLVASTEARFADTHARVGILPGWGLSQKLPRLVGIHRAKELSFTGNYLSAQQAEAWGLVSRVVAPADLLATCAALARDMLSCDPRTLRAYKRLIDDGFGRSFREGLALETERSRAHVQEVSAEDIAQRRASIQARGRTQTAKD
jgi:enoyl-CoA hydratase